MVRKFILPSGLTAKVGENAIENDQLVRDAKKHDLWFHLDNCPSPHVILYCHDEKEVDKPSIQACLQLCKFYSKQKLFPSSPAIYTQAKFVKQTHKAGMVHVVSRPKPVKVEYDLELLENVFLLYYKNVASKANKAISILRRKVVPKQSKIVKSPSTVEPNTTATDENEEEDIVVISDEPISLLGDLNEEQMEANILKSMASGGDIDDVFGDDNEEEIDYGDGTSSSSSSSSSSDDD